MALKSDGTVWHWGMNAAGLSANGRGKDSNVPMPWGALTDVVAITDGGSDSLALKSDGTVWHWGHESEFGSAPKQVLGLAGVVSITARHQHNLAVESDGTLWTWGDNGWGVLGNGNAFTVTPAPPPGLVRKISGVASASGGMSHSLALKRDGTVWAWGDNSSGQLGHGSYEGVENDYLTAPPARVIGLRGVVAIAGGMYHSLALKRDGTVWAWGGNDLRQLGHGSSEKRSVPVPVRAVIGARAPAAAIPRLTIRPARLNFVAASAPRTITVGNGGGATLSIDKVILTGIHPRDFNIADFCSGKALSAGQSCTIRVTLAPRAKSNRSAALLLVANAPGSPIVVPLSATNAANPCSYRAAPQALLPTRSGGIYSFDILTGPACAWRVSGLPTWIRANRGSGKGSTPYSLDIAPNEGPPRSATILLNDTPVLISQSGLE